MCKKKSWFISLIFHFSSAIGIIAEYTGIGDLYENVIGLNRIMIVILLGKYVLMN